MPEPFVHLHLHSHYSLLDATIRIEELVKQVASLGMEAVALTDHGNLFGVFEFVTAASKHGIRPIVGCELYVAPGKRTDRQGNPYGRSKPYHHLTVLVENETGWYNLMQLSTLSYLEGFYHRPRVDKELLARYREGLIALSGCLTGEIPQALLAGDWERAQRAVAEYLEIFGEGNFFLEVQDHGLHEEAVVRERMLELTRRTGVPLVVTNDCHFHRREDVDAHRVLIGIGQNKTLQQLATDYAYNDEFYVKSPEEMAALFPDLPDALARTAEIAQRCRFSLGDQKPLLPKYPGLPPGVTPQEFLTEKARAGLARRLARPVPRRHSDQEYWQRLEYELKVIHEVGFEGYFLIVWDFVNFARENRIPVGPGRGSAAGSLVSYALEITDIDPLEYDLLFERFLNPERISMPDIDIDFCKRRREEVIAHVRRVYGEENVCQIATFNVLQARSVIRDVGRVMGMSFGETDRIARLVPETLGVTLEQALQDSPALAELGEKDPRVGQLLAIGRRLEGLARHCGMHAAGVVIAPKPVREIVPLYRTNRDEIVTQFDKDVIEKLGLLKMDLLGLKTLTIMEDTLESISRSGETPPDLRNLRLDDPKVFELFASGDTEGIFQFESPGMRQLLVTTKPNRFEDLAALNALYRPGPMSWVNDFASRKAGRTPIVYIFPELEKILAETYGVIVYQEQVMRIAVELAGFTMAAADTLRKAMGKKIKELIDEQGEAFVAGAVAKGFDRAKVQALWEQIVPFAQYGFNKSHSVAYAFVAYQTAYLKVYYPLHFWAATLSSEVDDTDQLTLYVNALKARGVPILPPDVNRSLAGFTVENGAIRVGLAAVKGLGEAAVHAICQARAGGGTFRSVLGFLRALPDRVANKRTLESLIRSGSLDSLYPHRGVLLERLDWLLERASRQRQDLADGQGYLFGLETEEGDGLPDPATVEPWPSQEVLAGERETLGFYLSGHPLDRYRPILELLGMVPLAKLEDVWDAGDREVTVAGLVSGLAQHKTKERNGQAGRPMASFLLEDQTATVRAVAFPDAFERIQPLLANGKALRVVATLSRSSRDDKIELRVEDASPLEGIESRQAKAVRVTVPLALFGDREKLEELYEALAECEGPLPLRLRLVGGWFRAELVPARLAGVDPQKLLQRVRALLGPGHVEYLYT
ncbi:MAG: DNA polymerase III subunit alpha [Thermoanaerobaculum sp.]